MPSWGGGTHPSGDSHYALQTTPSYPMEIVARCAFLFGQEGVRLAYKKSVDFWDKCASN